MPRRKKRVTKQNTPKTIGLKSLPTFTQVEVDIQKTITTIKAQYEKFLSASDKILAKRQKVVTMAENKLQKTIAKANKIKIKLQDSKLTKALVKQKKLTKTAVKLAKDNVAEAKRELQALKNAIQSVKEQLQKLTTLGKYNKKFNVFWQDMTKKPRKKRTKFMDADLNQDMAEPEACVDEYEEEESVMEILD